LGPFLSLILGTVTREVVETGRAARHVDHELTMFRQVSSAKCDFLDQLAARAPFAVWIGKGRGENAATSFEELLFVALRERFDIIGRRVAQIRLWGPLLGPWVGFLLTILFNFSTARSKHFRTASSVIPRTSPVCRYV